MQPSDQKIHTPSMRMRRLRYHNKIRNLIRETEINKGDLIQPLFIHHDPKTKNPVSSMPGIYQLGLDHLSAEIDMLSNLDIGGIILFGIPKLKDALGSDSYNQNGIIQQAIRKIKTLNPNLLVISDICFCEYTDHGHCGALSERGGQLDVDNDATLNLLVKQAVSHVQAGTDIIAPSGNIDGMVAAIRKGLDAAQYETTPILSYAVKYASALYGPFREAAEGAPKFGDRKTYQMDPANSGEALREVELDVAEGADMLMVKPALAYLDIIKEVKQNYPGIPLSAYQVSGEYAMIKAAAQNGWLDEQRVVLEILTAIKRAGADFIISYFTKEVAGYTLKI